MSEHVFISYCDNDVHRRDMLIAELENVKIPFWFDAHIEEGREWRDEIDTRLQEAFAIAVIVTSPAMACTNVTYEWSWAIGNGTPVLPLLFENMPYTYIHRRLNKIHPVPCYENIPVQVIDMLQGHKQRIPDSQYLDNSVLNRVTAARIFARVYLFLCQYEKRGKVDKSLLLRLNNQLQMELRHASESLNELLVDKASVFTLKQKRNCIELCNQITSFQLSMWNYDTAQHSLVSDLRFLEDYRQRYWEAAIKPFEVAPNLYFGMINSHLDNLMFDSDTNYGIAVLNLFYDAQTTSEIRRTLTAIRTASVRS